MIPAMRAYVGQGANLGDRERTLRGAIEALAANHQIEVHAVSSLRETDPVGPVLLGAVALGLIAFGCFSLVEARYRRI